MKSLRRHIARTVIVNTVNGEAFRGVLASVDGDAVTLDHPSIVEPRAADLTGSAVIPAGRVTWVQVV